MRHYCASKISSDVTAATRLDPLTLSISAKTTSFGSVYFIIMKMLEQETRKPTTMRPAFLSRASYTSLALLATRPVELLHESTVHPREEESRETPPEPRGRRSCGAHSRCCWEAMWERRPMEAKSTLGDRKDPMDTSKSDSTSSLDQH